MASGEVLFILAFIVLPTAILVSSAWAVLFVRSRPDRNMQRWENESAVQDAQPTSMMTFGPERPVESNTTLAFDDDLPVTEHDVVVIDAADQLHDDDIETSQAPVPVEVEAEPEPETTSLTLDDAAIESPVLQSTEDLGGVADVLRDMEHVAQQKEVLAEVEPVVEAEPVPVVEEPVAFPEQEELQEEVAFSETSELPGLDLPASDDLAEDDTPEPEEERPAGNNWRRRKQSVKLMPGEGEAPRTRGRNRDTQRQVPQLGRFGRARNDGTQNPPPDGESDQDTTPGRT